MIGCWEYNDVTQSVGEMQPEIEAQYHTQIRNSRPNAPLPQPVLPAVPRTPLKTPHGYEDNLDDWAFWKVWSALCIGWSIGTMIYHVFIR